MSVPVLVGIALLGGLGAMLRLLVDSGISERTTSMFPLGTLVVNLSGAFALGVLSGVSAGSAEYRLLGTGLIGAFTTFSTWMFETHRLAQGGARRWAAANLGVSLGVGLALAWAGSKVGQLL